MTEKQGGAVKVAPTNNEVLAVDRSSLRARVAYAMASLRRSPVGIFGLLLVGLVIFMALFGGNVSPHDPTAHDLRARFKPPGFEGKEGVYLLGTDQLGRDVLSRAIVGSRVSVVVGLTSVVIAGTIARRLWQAPVARWSWP